MENALYKLLSEKSKIQKKSYRINAYLKCVYVNVYTHRKRHKHIDAHKEKDPQRWYIHI